MWLTHKAPHNFPGPRGKSSNWLFLPINTPKNKKEYNYMFTIILNKFLLIRFGLSYLSYGRSSAGGWWVCTGPLRVWSRCFPAWPVPGGCRSAPAGAAWPAGPWRLPCCWPALSSPCPNTSRWDVPSFSAPQLTITWGRQKQHVISCQGRYVCGIKEAGEWRVAMWYKRGNECKIFCVDITDMWRCEGTFL